MNSGYSVPSSTVAAAVDQQDVVEQERPRATARSQAAGLAARRAPGVQQSDRRRSHRQSSARMNTPRAGSVANACTEVSTPERTRKVPSKRQREREDRE